MLEYWSDNFVTFTNMRVTPEKSDFEKNILQDDLETSSVEESFNFSSSSECPFSPFCEEADKVANELEMEEGGGVSLEEDGSVNLHSTVDLESEDLLGEDGSPIDTTQDWGSESKDSGICGSQEDLLEDKFTGFEEKEQVEVFEACFRKADQLSYLATYLETYGGKIKTIQPRNNLNVQASNVPRRPKVKIVSTRIRKKTGNIDRKVAGKKAEKEPVLTDVNNWFPTKTRVWEEPYELGMLPPAWNNAFELSPNGWNTEMDIVSVHKSNLENLALTEGPSVFAPFELSELLSKGRLDLDIMRFTMGEMTRQHTEAMLQVKRIEDQRNEDFHRNLNKYGRNGECKLCGLSVYRPNSKPFLCLLCKNFNKALADRSIITEVLKPGHPIRLLGNFPVPAGRKILPKSARFHKSPQTVSKPPASTPKTRRSTPRVPKQSEKSTPRKARGRPRKYPAPPTFGTPSLPVKPSHPLTNKSNLIIKLTDTCAQALVHSSQKKI